MIFLSFLMCMHFCATKISLHVRWPWIQPLLLLSTFNFWQIPFRFIVVCEPFLLVSDRVLPSFNLGAYLIDPLVCGILLALHWSNILYQWQSIDGFVPACMSQNSISSLSLQVVSLWTLDTCLIADHEFGRFSHAYYGYISSSINWWDGASLWLVACMDHLFYFSVTIVPTVGLLYKEWSLFPTVAPSLRNAC